MENSATMNIASEPVKVYYKIPLAENLFTGGTNNG